MVRTRRYLLKLWEVSFESSSIQFLITRRFWVLRYEQALESMQHTMLLAPQNPFYVLQTAETAYTVGDIALSIKLFMTVVDMTTSDEDEKVEDSVPDGITLRAWFGVKQASVGLSSFT